MSHAEASSGLKHTIVHKIGQAACHTNAANWTGAQVFKTLLCRRMVMILHVCAMLLEIGIIGVTLSSLLSEIYKARSSGDALDHYRKEIVATSASLATAIIAFGVTILGAGDVLSGLELVGKRIIAAGRAILSLAFTAGSSVKPNGNALEWHGSPKAQDLNAQITGSDLNLGENGHKESSWAVHGKVMWMTPQTPLGAYQRKHYDSFVTPVAAHKHVGVLLCVFHCALWSQEGAYEALLQVLKGSPIPATSLPQPHYLKDSKQCQMLSTCFIQADLRMNLHLVVGFLYHYFLLKLVDMVSVPWYRSVVLPLRECNPSSMWLLFLEEGNLLWALSFIKHLTR
jgi:hypothetical protein